ncbi:non-structural maintenance of chromosomes element 4 homolog A [Candoia aspera]|uniref:non-structural maintenance of chromosomes element 4 homolog A n=1 Tax=Candoia aspera TaxID=51853 RepID=UPI002FD80999
MQRRSAPEVGGCARNGDCDPDGEEERRGGADRGLPGEKTAGEDFGDVTRRRLIRQQYRELISTVQQNRELMLSTSNDKLTEALEDADKLFTGVTVPSTREAALDAQFLVLASNLGKEKANQLRSDMTGFDPSAFAEDLLSLMGLNRLEREESEEQVASGFLPNNAWHKLGEEAKKHFRRAPVFHFMLGTFTPDPPAERPRIERQRKKKSSDGNRAMPAQLKRMEESHQEATEKEVERILGFLQAYYAEEPDTPISFLEFVTDPNSFARTVENMFHVSFLIRDGLARIKLDQDKLPVIEPLNPEGGKNDEDTQARKQAVISINYQEWQNIVETFEISMPMIPPPS